MGSHRRQAELSRPSHYAPCTYCPPEGNADPGESIFETALREVKEETGLDCRIVYELPTVRYNYTSGRGNLKPKVVHYYLMERVGGRLQAPGQEADAAEWCDAGQAAVKLTYQHDRELLHETLRLILRIEEEARAKS